MDIMLVNAPVTVSNEHARLTPPLGLAYLASALIEAGYRVGAVDYNVSGLNLRRVDSFVSYDKPRIVGISAHTETYGNALRIAARVKEQAPETVVVLGGAHATILPEAALAEECVDYVVVGAGERSIVELARFVLEGEGRLEDVPGLGWVDGGGVARVNARAELPDPDDFPRPARHLFPLEFYADKYNVLTATGSCPYRCPFCSAASVWQGRRKLRSPKSVVDEIRWLQANYPVDRVFLTDDILTVNKKWVRDLAEELGTLQHPMRWGCATRVDTVDDELLRVMAAAGCDGIQFGVESGAQSILDSVKGIERAQVLRAVEGAVAAGIEVVSSFMVPFPEDTRETLAETHRFIKDVGAAGSRILLSYTCPYPGTRFYDEADDLGITILAKDWDEYDAKHVTMETRHLRAAEIEEIVEAIAADIGLTKSI